MTTEISIWSLFLPNHHSSAYILLHILPVFFWKSFTIRFSHIGILQEFLDINQIDRQKELRNSK